VVCDIRYSPASRHPQWTKRQLAQLLDARYQHVQTLGNRHYETSGPIALADYEVGKQVIAGILTNRQSVILMCCKDVAMCHRHKAAEQLAAYCSAVPIIHLVLPKTRRTQEAQGQLFSWSDGAI
jgi:hypothetical protein